MKNKRFEITEATGRTVIGMVQGSGNMLCSLDDLNKAIRQANRDRPTHCYEPKPGHVDVYPFYCNLYNGPAVIVNLKNATAKEWKP